MHDGNPVEVLDSGRSPRRSGWLIGALIVAVVLLGWRLTAGSDPPVAAPAPSSIPLSATPEDPTYPSPGPADTIEDVAFLDSARGYLVQRRCDAATPEPRCARVLLDTVDGGRTWQPRAQIPAFADVFQRLVVEPPNTVLLLEQVGSAALVRSEDGGRSWFRLSIAVSAPAPARAGALVVKQQQSRPCPRGCPITLAWLDLATQQRRPFPTQPAHSDLLVPSEMSADGDVVATLTGADRAVVTMSTDGGLTWSETALPVPLRAGADPAVAVSDVTALAAGGGRAYAFVSVQQVATQPVLSTTYGFRTDDGGATWVDLGLPADLLVPSVAVHGELATTDTAGQILVSTAGGTTWAPVRHGPPETSYLAQDRADGPVFAVAFAEQQPQLFLSFDALGWLPVEVPAG